MIEKPNKKRYILSEYEVRLLKKYSNRELANILRISYSYVSMIINGKRTVSERIYKDLNSIIKELISVQNSQRLNAVSDEEWEKIGEKVKQRTEEENKKNQSLKDVLSPEEYKKVCEENTNIVIGALKHEGYKDNGRLRELLRKVHDNEITFEEAIDIILHDKH